MEAIGKGLREEGGNAMKFYMPTQVWQERDAVRNHATELAALGQKALILTGRHSSKINGSLEDVKDALTSQGRSYVVFDEVEENPSVETVCAAAEIGKREGVDFVIGVGGGSPMDAAKAAALLIANPQETEECLYTPKDIRALPLAEVPTTAGTGSETTPYAVLTYHKEHTKRSISYRIFPELALVDEKYLAFAGPKVLVSTAVDALAHLLEAYLNTGAASFSDMLCERGMGIWSRAKGALVSGQPNEQEYQYLMEASTIAGMAISHAATSLPHGMSYYLTYEKGLPHGVAVGLFQYAYMDAFEDKEKVGRALKILGFETAEAFRAFLTGLIGEYSITADERDTYAKGMMSNAKKLANFPYEMTGEKMQHMFNISLQVTGEEK